MPIDPITKQPTNVRRILLAQYVHDQDDAPDARIVALTARVVELEQRS